MIVKSKSFKDFTVIQNEILRRKDISFRAKGLFAYLCSLPSDWVVRKTELFKNGPEGRDSIIKAFDELVKHGYILGVQKVARSGQFDGVEYIVYPESQLPSPDIQEPVNGKPVTGLPLTENPELLNTIQQRTITKQDILSSDQAKSIISYLNEKTGKSFKHTTAATKRLITARLRDGFDVDAFRKVIDVKTSKWLSDPKMKDYLRPETLFGAKFESYLNEWSPPQIQGWMTRSAPATPQPESNYELWKRNSQQ